MAAGEDGLACPVLLPGAHGCSDKGIGYPAQPRLVLLFENGRRRVAGMQPSALDACGGIDCLSICA
jgi:hypothetical protein